LLAAILMAGCNLIASVFVLYETTQIGGPDYQVNSVTHNGSTPVYGGSYWTPSSEQQGYTYTRAGGGSDVPWAQNGWVASVSGPYVLGTGSGWGYLNGVRLENVSPSDPTVPAAVNAAGEVVGNTWLTSQPLRYTAGGELQKLPFGGDFGGAAVALDQNLTVGHTFALAVYMRAALWTDNTLSYLADESAPSYATCIAGGIVGGSYGGKAVYWQRSGSDWTMSYVLNAGSTIDGEITAITSSGIFGGNSGGGTFLGRLGDGYVENIASTYGISAFSFAGISQYGDHYAIALNGDGGAWALEGFTAVPEPAEWGMVTALVCAGLIVIRHRKKPAVA